MQLSVDTQASKLTVGDEVLDLYSPEAFQRLTELWTVVGWQQKYSYRFSWLGRPVIQLPEDLMRMQELIYELKPTTIIETGVAHGGSLVFYASLMRSIGVEGRVIGVDIDIRAPNRAAIESHELAGMIELVEGDSVSNSVLDRVKALVQAEGNVLVSLDSNHLRDHVALELEAYHGFVTRGSVLVVMDGVMQDVADTPRGDASWHDDNPLTAVAEFLATNEDFDRFAPAPAFDESEAQGGPTYWRDGWLRRRR